MMVWVVLAGVCGEAWGHQARRGAVLRVLPVIPTQDPDVLKKVPEDFRAVYPEFLPAPKPEYRNRLREKLERQDMLSRRSVMPIPEFYVGESLFIIVLGALEMHQVETL
ncbi:39S ribosomal protein L19, mitochondrial [Portunus trituberculatus]|uniref:39S ribosomal protein L19, mitochondrial n=1 Tax=Portunus trituberculatus TaxID=210409 RepID=A0A5B7IYC9_PORTR|nr:39S ribosomal protein L19, mitochondrial [Portunus trituberculatus]